MTAPKGEVMKKRLGKLFTQLAAYVLVGAAVMVGIRVIEWTVPQPEMRVIVCTYADLGELECKGAAELLRKPAKNT
jgi:hypothetical protein